MPQDTSGQCNTPVTLHVYHVGGHAAVRGLNSMLKPLGVGAFHAAVEVHGKEWSYGMSTAGTSGIFSCAPRRCDSHVYLESQYLGRTSLSDKSVRRMLNEMSKKWLGQDYSLTRHNCCDFANEFCQRLEVSPLPAWVNRLGSASAALDPAPAVESVLLRGKLSRGALPSDGYRFGDLSRGVLAAVGAASIEDVVGKGSSPPPRCASAKRGTRAGSKTSDKHACRGSRHDRGGRADPIQVEEVAMDEAVYRGGCQGPARVANGIVALGKLSRGARADDAYQFGDFTRGLVRQLTL
uniref:PPPDE domain-containing protein n=1 Tax=Noctiluca scintillans TaxID=2966 RepID=A0A7S1A0J0_NOCSC